MDATGDEVLGLDPKCDDMCPAPEREDRAGAGQLHPLEWVEAGNRYLTSAGTAVKKYTRSEAGDKPNASLIRTWQALDKSMIHLRTLLDTGTVSLIRSQPFFWDRYRAIRKDMTQQGLARKGHQQLAWCIATNEEIARFHIAVDEELAEYDKVNVRPEDEKRPKAEAIQFNHGAASAGGTATEVSAAAADAAGAGAGVNGATLDDKYDGHLNHQELTKTLLDLAELYSLAQAQGVPTPNVAEFTAYYPVLMAGQHGGFYKKTSDIVKTLNTCTEDMLRSPQVQFAIELMEVLRQGNWRGYFKLLHGAPYLLAAAAQVYLPNMRSTALEALVASGPPLPGHQTVRHHALLSQFSSELLFDSMDDAMHFAGMHGLTVQRLPAGGAEAVALCEDRASKQQFKRPKLLPRQRLGFIAAKRGEGRAELVAVEGVGGPAGLGAGKETAEAAGDSKPPSAAAPAANKCATTANAGDIMQAPPRRTKPAAAAGGNGSAAAPVDADAKLAAAAEEAAPAAPKHSAPAAAAAAEGSCSGAEGSGKVAGVGAGDMPSCSETLTCCKAEQFPQQEQQPAKKARCDGNIIV